MTIPSVDSCWIARSMAILRRSTTIRKEMSSLRWQLVVGLSFVPSALGGEVRARPAAHCLLPDAASQRASRGRLNARRAARAQGFASPGPGSGKSARHPRPSGSLEFDSPADHRRKFVEALAAAWMVSVCPSRGVRLTPVGCSRGSKPKELTMGFRLATVKRRLRITACEAPAVDPQIRAAAAR